jgi:pimeloyl-ACP methyl ester carboxylesterase
LWLKDHFKNSKLYEFKEIGHMIPVEAPDQLADVLIVKLDK